MKRDRERAKQVRVVTHRTRALHCKDRFYRCRVDNRFRKGRPFATSFSIYIYLFIYINTYIMHVHIQRICYWYYRLCGSFMFERRWHLGNQQVDSQSVHFPIYVLGMTRHFTGLCSLNFYHKLQRYRNNHGNIHTLR